MIVIFTAISNLNEAYDSDRVDEIKLTYYTNFTFSNISIASVPSNSTTYLNGPSFFFQLFIYLLRLKKLILKIMALEEMLYILELHLYMMITM
jgi:hypothetical protein